MPLVLKWMQAPRSARRLTRWIAGVLGQLVAGGFDKRSSCN
jgi:hypothetical protein